MGEDRERGGQSLVPLREIRGARERLTEAQTRVLLALAAGYSVCMSMSSLVASHERVCLGNGSRLAAVTVESLLFRGLIEQGGFVLEPPLPPGYPEHWRKKIMFYQLTEAGRDEVLRQKRAFVAEEVVLSLPYRVILLLEEVTRYQLQWQREPEVAVRGVMDTEKPGWCIRIPTWRCVRAYDEANNLLGLEASAHDTDGGTLLWAKPPNPLGGYLTSSVRVRLRPA